MTGYLGVLLGLVVVVSGGIVAVILGQARHVQRIVPLAVQPPPRGEGLIGPRFAGRPLTIAILGDSFAAGYGATKPRETVGVLLATALSRRIRRRVQLYRPAFVGAMSSDLSHQVDAALQHAPDVAVVYIGGNDVTRFSPLRAAAGHLGEAVHRLRAAGCQVVVGTCPDLGVLPPLRPPLRWLATVRSHRLAAAQTDAVVAAGGHPIALADLLNPYFKADPVRMFGTDRFHPSPEGYARAAAVTLPTLLTALRTEGLLGVEDRDVCSKGTPEARRRLDGAPWLWWVGADSDAGVAEGLKAAGLRQIQAMPVMAVELDKVRTLPGPEGLIIERAETPADIAAFAEAYAPSMGVPHEAVTAMAEREKRRSSAQAEIVRFVARIDGRIVGTAAASISHGVLGVYVVTADPGHRRQGIGTAVTAAALRVGQDRGLLVGTLQASPDGEPVYRRMGFRTVGTYGLFSL